jgi:hypothetical protein
MNTKPILIVRFPHVENISYDKYMEHILSHDLRKEYHVLFLKETNREQVGFEVLNVSDYDSVKMDELQEMINKNFQEQISKTI